MVLEKGVELSLRTTARKTILSIHLHIQLRRIFFFFVTKIYLLLHALAVSLFLKKIHESKPQAFNGLCNKYRQSVYLKT